jgi:ELWxxDGT repeat protein
LNSSKPIVRILAVALLCAPLIAMTPSSFRTAAPLGAILFTARDGGHGRELWASDGTPSGSFMVKDISPGPTGSQPGSLVVVGRTVFFRANDGEHGSELWTSDGTESGTVLVSDISMGQAGSEPKQLSEVGGLLYFTANDGEHGRELWKSDGTSTGTSIVRDIRPGPKGSHPSGLTDVSGVVFFVAEPDVKERRELWRSLGEATTTSMVARDLDPEDPWAAPRALIGVGETLFFELVGGIEELWKSDGTPEGTSRVKVINRHREYLPFSAMPMWNVGGTLYLMALRDTSGHELWTSDGTNAGTVLVRDICPGSTSSLPGWLTEAGESVFFAAGCYLSDEELWKTDGTTEGTVRVKDINPGDGSAGPVPFATVGETLFLFADDGATGIELWTSDGTEAGTRLLRDIHPGSEGSGLSWPFSTSAVTSGNVVFFATDEGANGVELWKSDGTPSGTILVSNIYPGARSSKPQNLVLLPG